jgi:hypothetical protein
MDENGIVRRSRTPRVLAWLVRIRKIQVLSDERPSKLSSSSITATQVSCATSSATSAEAT